MVTTQTPHGPLWAPWAPWAQGQRAAWIGLVVDLLGGRIGWEGTLGGAALWPWAHGAHGAHRGPWGGLGGNHFLTTFLAYVSGPPKPFLDHFFSICFGTHQNHYFTIFGIFLELDL